MPGQTVCSDMRIGRQSVRGAGWLRAVESVGGCLSSFFVFLNRIGHTSVSRSAEPVESVRLFLPVSAYLREARSAASVRCACLLQASGRRLPEKSGILKIKCFNSKKMV